MRSSRSPGRWVAGATAFAAVLFLVCSAAAQTISLNSGGSPNPERTEGLHDEVPIYGINRQDCLADDVFRFRITASNVTTQTLEVWAGEGSTDCGTPDGRSNRVGECWLLYSASSLDNDSSNVVEIPARTIVAKDTAASASAPHSPSAEDCAVPASDAPISVAMYFTLVSSSTVQSSFTFDQAVIDMAGPPELQNIRISEGEQQLVVRWDEPSSNDVERRWSAFSRGRTRAR